MAAVSYLDVFGIHLAPEEVSLAPGDTVRMGTNLFPHFRVIAVHHDKVWVRNVETGADGLASISRCRKIDG
jgi:hypothetical protein